MKRTLDRWTQFCLALGGVFWTAVFVHRAAMPVAPPDESRPGGVIFDLRLVAALALVAIGMVGVHSARARSLGRLGNIAVSLICAGVLTMALYVLELMPVYPMFIVGSMSILLGTVLLAAVGLRSKAISRAAAIPLIVGCAIFLGFNPEDRRAYLAVPLGLAWVWLAYHDWRIRRQSAQAELDRRLA